jgi:DNA-binding protein HU-beta
MISTPPGALKLNKNAWQCFIDIKENRPTKHMAEATRMTQTQIVKELAETTGVGNKVAKQFMEKFAELAVRETKKKGVFVMPGIGRLVRVERKARTGRNPATGESIKIPAKKVVKFRIAKAVKDAIVPPKVKKA